MTVTLNKSVSIDFTVVDGDEIKDWLAQLRMKAEEIPDLEVTVAVEVSLAEFNDDDIKLEYQGRFGDDDAVARAYRLLAAGDVDDAMDELSRAFDLAPPYHEKRIAAGIARGRQGELHV